MAFKNKNRVHLSCHPEVEPKDLRFLAALGMTNYLIFRSFMLGFFVVVLSFSGLKAKAKSITPAEIIKEMNQILEPQQWERVFDVLKERGMIRVFNFRHLCGMFRNDSLSYDDTRKVLGFMKKMGWISLSEDQLKTSTNDDLELTQITPLSAFFAQHSSILELLSKQITVEPIKADKDKTDSRATFRQLGDIYVRGPFENHSIRGVIEQVGGWGSLYFGYWLLIRFPDNPNLIPVIFGTSYHYGYPHDFVREHSYRLLSVLAEDGLDIDFSHDRMQEDGGTIVDTRERFSPFPYQVLEGDVFVSTHSLPRMSLRVLLQMANYFGKSDFEDLATKYLSPTTRPIVAKYLGEFTRRQQDKSSLPSKLGTDKETSPCQGILKDVSL